MLSNKGEKFTIKGFDFEKPLFFKVPNVDEVRSNIILKGFVSKVNFDETGLCIVDIKVAIGFTHVVFVKDLDECWQD